MKFIRGGVEAGGHAEKIISGIGGFIGILLAMWVSQHYLGTQGAALLVASMGASAVLLFAVPNGALSQPWPLMGGHVFSALIGVSCAQLVPDMLIAAPLAVALAIALMYYLRCIHPPGGATAITAVIGGAQVHDLGFQFVLTPVLINALILLLAAIAVNYAFPWRRYPARLQKTVKAVQSSSNDHPLGQADFRYALDEIGTYVDIREEDLLRLYRLACKHAWQLSDLPDVITSGFYYSNGETGDSLSVRRVIECSGAGTDALITFTVVAGEGVGAVNTMTLAEFTGWQRYEVIFKNGEWHRIRQASTSNPH